MSNQLDCSLQSGVHGELNFRSVLKDKKDREFIFSMADHNQKILLKLSLDRLQVEHLARTMLQSIGINDWE